MKKISKYIVGIVLILVVITITGCNDEGFIRDKFGVYGTAKTMDADDFDHIELKTGELRDSFSWTDNGLNLRYKGKKSVDNDIIALWDTTKLFDGRRSLKMSVFDKQGVSNSEYTYFTLDNVFVELYMTNLEIIKESKDKSEDSKDEEKDSKDEEIECSDYGDYSPCFYDIKKWCNNGELVSEDYCSSDCGKYDEHCYGKTLCYEGNNCVPIIGIVDKKGIGNYKIDYTNLNLIDWKDKGVILEEGNLKKELGDGGERLFDILGYLYYSKLPYNGIYQLKIKIYDKKGDIINEDLSHTFQVFGLENDLPVNKIENPSRNTVKGYLKLWIERDNNGVWENYLTLSDDKIERTIITEGNLKLSKIIINTLTNKNKLQVNEPGFYKIKMEFSIVENKIIKDEFEFEVLGEKFVSYNKCEDETRRLECSVTRPLICNNKLILVDNCRACGCNNGQTCQDSGKCI